MRMPALILATFALFHAVAAADTRIVEYPDHFYVESTDAGGGKPEVTQDSAVQPSGDKPSQMSPDTAKGVGTPSAPTDASPTTRNNGKPAYNEEEAATLRPDLVAEMERLENERTQLLDFDVAAHPDEVNSRRQQAIEIIQQINRISADLKQYYLQYQEQMQRNR